MFTEATLLNCFWSYRYYLWQVLMLFKTLEGFSLVVANLHSSIWFLKTAGHTSFGTKFGGWVSWINITFGAGLLWLPHVVWRIPRNPLCALSKSRALDHPHQSLPGTDLTDFPVLTVHWMPSSPTANILLESVCPHQVLVTWEYMPWKALLSTLLASHSQAF